MPTEVATSCIKGFVKNTLIDWEGKIACLLFLGGCNFRCPFCHNGDLVENSAAIPGVPTKEVLDYLEQQRGWIDGVVVSGGEPTLSEDLTGLLSSLKEQGMPVKLDTNGTRPARLAQLVGKNLIDAVSMDIKAPLNEKYNLATATKVDVAALRDSMRLFRDSKLDVVFRTTVCPVFLGEEDLVAIAEEITDTFGGHAAYVLQQFRPLNCLDKSFEKVVPYSTEELTRMLGAVREILPQAVLRGTADD